MTAETSKIERKNVHRHWNVIDSQARSMAPCGLVERYVYREASE